MFPSEGLYFRQDKPQQCKINSCQHDECWQPTKNNQNFCVLHQKMHQDEAIKIFTGMFRQLGKLWRKFIEELRQSADEDDQSQIHFDQFLSILNKYQVKLSQKQKDAIQVSFPGQKAGDINIARIYDQKYSIILEKMYKKVDVSNFEGTDEPEDINGYLGKTKFYRGQKS